LRKILAILVVFLLLINVGAISMVQAQTAHEIAMDAAITKGIDYLNTLQAVDGHVGANYYVGETALYLLALLDHNVSKNDPHVLNATNYILSQVQADGSIYSGNDPNYQTAGAIMALQALKNSTLLPTISNAANYVLSSQAPDGSFGYSAGVGSGDLSNSQYSILGLKAAELAGWTPPSSTPYTKLANWVKTQQNADGGYGTYLTASSGAGTSAALICLSLSGVALNDPSIQGGITWLKNNFSYTTNPGYDWLGAYYYYLYGAMKALTFCGITNQVGGVMDPTTAANPGVAGDRGWYFDFTEHLIVTQYASGDWPAIWSFGHADEVAMAVLVLERSTVVPPPQTNPVGGEIISVNMLQLLAPYLLIALFAAAASGLLLRYRRRIT